MKAIEQYVPVLLFIMLYKVVLTFESVDEILKCNHSNESYRAVLSLACVAGSIRERGIGVIRRALERKGSTLGGGGEGGLLTSVSVKGCGYSPLIHRCSSHFTISRVVDVLDRKRTVMYAGKNMKRIFFSIFSFSPRQTDRPSSYKCTRPHNHANMEQAADYCGHANQLQSLLQRKVHGH